jgi:hypothetical protein
VDGKGSVGDVSKRIVTGLEATWSQQRVGRP